MDGHEFVYKSYNALKSESHYIDFKASFQKEQELTKHIVLGLRRLFADCFDLGYYDKELNYHIIYRQGDNDYNKIAWRQSKATK